MTAYLATHTRNGIIMWATLGQAHGVFWSGLGTTPQTDQANVWNGNKDEDNQQTNTGVNAHYIEAFDYYSKIEFLDKNLAVSLLPVEDYPLDDTLGEILKTQSLAVSPTTASDLPDIDANELIEILGGLPALPGEKKFWDELMQVALIQGQRSYNGPPPFRLPTIWKGFSCDAVAEAVHDEYPGYWHQKLLQSVWSEGLAMDNSIIPFHSVVDFVGNQIRLADLNTWAIGAVCPPNFLLKWTVGRLRPEEAAFQITKGLMKGVPKPLETLIKWLDLKTPEQFTSYPEGRKT